MSFSVNYFKYQGAAGAVIFAALIVVAQLLESPYDGAIDETNATLVAHGRIVYAEACASCHGEKLEGQENWRERRPDGKLPAPPHDASGHTWHHPDAVLFKLTREGLQSVVPNYQSDMPAFRGTLPDYDIRASLAYIKSTWPADIRARQAEISRQAQGQ